MNTMTPDGTAIDTDTISVSEIYKKSGLWEISKFITCPWTSKLAHGQVKDKNPLVRIKFTCPKIDIFYLYTKMFAMDTRHFK